MSSSRKVLAVWSMANITNLLGMLGVIGSLIFVGIEIRQNQEIAMAAQLSARNTALMAFYSAPLEGSAIALRLMEGGIEPEIDWANDEERATLIAIVSVRILSLLNAYYQYNSGLIVACYLLQLAFHQKNNKPEIIYDLLNQDLNLE